MKLITVKNQFRLGALALALTFASCTKDQPIDAPTEETPEEAVTSAEDPNAVIKYLGNEDLKVVPQEDGSFTMGDIVFLEGQLTDAPEDLEFVEPSLDAGQKLAAAGRIRKWTNNTVVYVKQNLPENIERELKKSMDEWSSKTNVRFKERTNESNYVTIRMNGRNCNCGSANLGMNGSRGVINLGSRTTAVVLIHEIGHTLGYIHEQNRSDRDDYIKINFENISDGAADQFYKSSNPRLLTSKFDVKSTMMYGSYTFSKNRKPTITDLNGNALPRRQAPISEGDIAGTNVLYPGKTNPNPNPNPTPENECDNIEQWSPNKSYKPGDRVVYRDYIFERDIYTWTLIKKCGTDTNTNDICKDVEPYNRNKTYKAGDKVTFRGNLYVLGNDGRFRKEGQCNG